MSIKKGEAACQDNEYKGNGTHNLFLYLETGCSQCLSWRIADEWALGTEIVACEEPSTCW